MVHGFMFLAEPLTELRFHRLTLLLFEFPELGTIQLTNGETGDSF